MTRFGRHCAVLPFKIYSTVLWHTRRNQFPGYPRFETTTVVLDSVWYLPLDEAPGAKVEAVARKLPPDYTVGEVELVVDSVGGVDEAHAVINSTIARLGSFHALVYSWTS